MDWTTILVALVSAIFGGGGIAALLRARGENQVNMLQAMTERIIRLEERNDAQDKRNDALARENAEKLGRIAALERDRETLNERLGVQRQLLDDQSVRLAMLGEREEENANLRQRLQVEMSTRGFLEREVAELKTENRQLKTRIQELITHGADDDYA